MNLHLKLPLKVQKMIEICSYTNKAMFLITENYFLKRLKQVTAVKKKFYWTSWWSYDLYQYLFKAWNLKYTSLMILKLFLQHRGQEVIDPGKKWAEIRNMVCPVSPEI